MTNLKVINLNKKEATDPKSVFENEVIESEEITFSGRKKQTVGSLKSNQNLFSIINGWLNKMSLFQYLLFITTLLLLSLIGFQKITSIEVNPITGIRDLLISETMKCDDDLLNPLCWPNKIIPQLEETDGYTNALLVGIDTRENDKGLLNTDTLMVASYSHKDGKTVLISFPRDLYVPYQINGNPSGYYSRINSIYAMGVNRKDLDGMELLKENIESYLDLEIHYTAVVNFRTVIDLVDAIDGIDIDVKANYTDIYPYKELSKVYQDNCIRAASDPAYCVFKYEAGINHLNGEEALIYSRMRQYSSDFDRARRQQEVIDAVKNKFLSGDDNIISKVGFAWNIYNSLLDENNITSNVTNNDLLAASTLLTKADPRPISIVLDPNFGESGKYMFGTMVGQDEEGNGGMSVVKIFDPTFADIRKEIARVREFPDLYRDNASVVIVNRTGEKFGISHEANVLKSKNPYFDFLAIQTNTLLDSDIESEMFIFNKDKADTVEYLKNNLNIKRIVEVDEFSEEKQTNYKEDIKIVYYNQTSTLDNINENSETSGEL